MLDKISAREFAQHLSKRQLADLLRDGMSSQNLFITSVAINELAHRGMCTTVETNVVWGIIKRPLKLGEAFAISLSNSLKEIRTSQSMHSLGEEIELRNDISDRLDNPNFGAEQLAELERENRAFSQLGEEAKKMIVDIGYDNTFKSPGHDAEIIREGRQERLMEKAFKRPNDDRRPQATPRVEVQPSNPPEPAEPIGSFVVGPPQLAGFAWRTA